MSTDAPRPLALVGGTLVDGTGSPARPATVVVRDGRIADLVEPGSRLGTEQEVLDCTGLIVAPGFIDTHSHADNVPFLVPDDTTKIEQGITTEVIGNCGFSLGPVEPAHRDALETLSRRIFPELDLAWNSVREMFAATDAAGYVTNYVPLVGHNALRIAAMGDAGRPADDSALVRMVASLEEALEAGVFGMSSGLVYPPGMFSEPVELSRLTAALGVDRVYATHMRNESLRVRTSIAETLGAAAGRCRLHVSHLKIADRKQWGGMHRVLDDLDTARDRGDRVTQDAYPYAAGSTMLSAVLPPWFHDGGTPAVLARLRSPEALARARSDVERDTSFENLVVASGWDGLVVSSTRSHRGEGASLQQLADRHGGEPFDELVRVLREEELQATMVMHMMHQDDVRTVLRHPSTAIGSDALPPGTGGRPHPRTYGTFPRFLGHYVRDEALLPLPEAIRRLTSLPADIFGLSDRGRLQRGMTADIVTFSAADIGSDADYEEPTRRPTGIGTVVQAGHQAVLDGRYLGHRRGRRLVP